MWGMRQRDFEIAKQARLDGHDEMVAMSLADRDAARESFFAAGEAARAYRLIWRNQVLPQVVYLKFTVEGWGDGAQVVGMRHTGTAWKIFGESFESAR